MGVKDALVDRILKLPEEIARELYERFDDILEDIYDAISASDAREEGFVSLKDATRRLVEVGKLPADYLKKIPEES